MQLLLFVTMPSMPVISSAIKAFYLTDTLLHAAFSTTTVSTAGRAVSLNYTQHVTSASSATAAAIASHAKQPHCDPLCARPGKTSAPPS